ncbi:MAG: hypothetical protein EBR82_15360 [Caulobacteraceae bacterium]|nr:hypothetical protein [Caulobacteraceae bacterium]
MNPMKPVPTDALIVQLTIIERSARQCRESLALATVLAERARKPAIELASPDVVGRLNGGGMPPSPQAHAAQQAQQFGAAANIELQNVIGHAQQVMQLLAAAQNGEDGGHVNGSLPS